MCFILRPFDLCLRFVLSQVACQPNFMAFLADKLQHSQLFVIYTAILTVFLLFSADYSAMASAEVPDNDVADPNFAAKRRLRCKRTGIFKEDDLKMS